MNNTKGNIYLSAKGIKLFQDRLEKQHHAYAQICKEREIAHELSGDGWHDNPHFNYLQQMEANSSWKIFELQGILDAAKRYEVKDGSRPTHRVELGSVVKFLIVDIQTDKETEQTVELVGYEEGEPTQGQVSYAAPIGKALMGLSKEDYFETRLPQGEVFIEVLELYSSRTEAGLSELKVDITHDHK